jgi:alanine dehydrogenase
MTSNNPPISNDVIQVLDAASVRELSPMKELVCAMEYGFQHPPTAPPRLHYDLVGSAPGASIMLVMPCWEEGGFFGLKNVSVVPGNAARGLPTVSGLYQLFDAATGQLLALMDAPELTARRTAAASALASRFLSRQNAKRMVMAGTGKLAPYLIEAHGCVRDLDEVLVWGRRPEKVTETIKAVQGIVPAVAGAIRAASCLETAVRQADIVSTATTAQSPFIKGDWLRLGVHLDLVGAYTPNMCEADAKAVGRANVFVDTYEGAQKEAGDILQAIQVGEITHKDIQADLATLATGQHEGREDEGAITLFKSVGTSIEDFTAAKLVFTNGRNSKNDTFQKS